MIVIMMGAAGAGKTTIGRKLAESQRWRFVEGDDLHPAANIAKMAVGIPLTDADRAPWLAALRAAILSWIAQEDDVVLACSALKRAYRNILRVSDEVSFVYLSGSIELFRVRVGLRQGHYAKANLLPSQFETLEEPNDAIVADAGLPPELLVKWIRAELHLPEPPAPEGS